MYKFLFKSENYFINIIYKEVIVIVGRSIKSPFIIFLFNVDLARSDVGTLMTVFIRRVY